MQNLKSYRVTDGNDVVGSFRTRKAARYYLVNSRIWDSTNLVWRPIREDGFYVEHRNADGEWQREGRQ